MIDAVLSAADAWGWSFVFWSVIGVLSLPLHFLVAFVGYWRNRDKSI